MFSVYARANSSGLVTHIFSDCFENPKVGDILIKQGNGDEFIHVGYYDLFTLEGAHKYKIVNNVLTECTQKELENEIKDLISTFTPPLE